MRLLSWLLCVAAAFVPAITSEERGITRPKRDSSEKKIVCYYTNWSVYRPGTAKFTPQNINPYLCTHLIYAFGGLSKENALKPFDKYQDIEQGGYAKFNGLKTYNKNLKTMLAIGGWNEGSARFSPLVADAERRRELVKNTVKFLRQNHFDGLDLDWEYPSFRDGGKPRDRDNYASLVQEFREEFERESEKTGRPRLLLTMAVPAGIEYIDKGYDVPKLNKYLDWMNILSYDYHSAFEPAINHHSPLFSLEEDDEYNFDAALNIDHTVQHYLKLGADKSKLVLGIPTYGRSYSLFNPDATDIGSPADGPGEQGEATREKGYLAYYEICERISSGGWTVENPNPEAMGPYAYKGNQWVGYDDEDIVRIKAKYVNDNDLGGIMFWSIDNDDFRGKCHGKPYPLIEAAKEALLANANELVPSTRSGSSRSNLKKTEQETTSKTKPRKTRLRTKSSTTTESSKTKANGRTTTTPQPPTTPDPGSDFVCKDEGFFPHPRDCKKYFWCLDSGPSSLGIVAHQFTCPSGLVFNKISDSCDYARNVICKTKSEPATTTTTTTTTSTTARTTTVRSRLVITASPPKTTSTTTTEAPEEEEEEEEESEDEEDPGTIKELINLIKKLGGVEQLEKQLNIQNSEGKEKIKPSLYTRVLQGRTANKFRGVTGETSTQKYISTFRNRPVGPQSSSTEEVSTSTRDNKPRYVTIQRNRPTVKTTTEEEDEEDEDVEKQPKLPVQETPRSFRRRPATDTTTEKEYTVFRRSRPQKEEEVSTPKYKNIVRVRSTTEAAVKEEEEEEEEPAKEVVEEEIEEEEDEVDDEDDETEVEPLQKQKKYSSIIRDNKKVVAEEEESKVSGPLGLQTESGISTPTVDSVLSGRDYVNNVNTVTSPRYVEIRRTQPTSTDPTEQSVHIVNNSHDVNVDKLNDVYESQPEGRENSVGGLQRRITTEIVKQPTLPFIKSSTLARTTPISIETTYTDSSSPRVRERQSSTTTSETTPTFSIRPSIQYQTLNRKNPYNQFSGTKSEEKRLTNQEKPFRSFSTTSEISPTTEIKRFQFAPRTKPAILTSKAVETATERFQITVPDTFDSPNTENDLTFPPALSATLEPTTLPIPDRTFIYVPDNSILSTTHGDKKSSLSTSPYIPTTSTQTSVVTSITESSITERKRIFVPKKSRSKSNLDSTEPFITEQPLETTKPYSKSLLTKFNGRISTFHVETEETRPRRFKIKSTTPITPEDPLPPKKYIPKKVRGFKAAITEAPEVSSTTERERTRFQPRNKLRQTEVGYVEPSNSLQSRFNTAKRKKLFSKKEEDDLEVQQTATFFENDFESNDRYILGGAIKQSSDKDFLNADVLFKTVPTVEEEEKADKLNIDTPNRNNGSKLININPALRNFRTRTRTLIKNQTAAEATTSKTTSTSNFKFLRSRQQNDNDKTINTTEESGNLGLNQTQSNRTFRLRVRRPVIRNKVTENNENSSPSTFGSRATDSPLYSTRSLNSINRLRSLRPKIQNPTTETIDTDTNFDDIRETNDGEVQKENAFLRIKTNQNLTESTRAEGDAQNYRNSRSRNQIFIKNVRGKEDKDSSAKVSELPVNTQTSERYTTVRSTPKTTVIKKVLASTLKRYKSTTEETQLFSETALNTNDELTAVTDPTVDSTFGTKIGFSVTSATVAPTTNPFSAKVGTIKGTYITVPPKVVSSVTTENVLTTKDNAVTELFRTTARKPNVLNVTSSNFRAFTSRDKQNQPPSENTLENSSLKPNRVIRTRGRVKAIDSIFQATEIGSVNESVTDPRNGGAVFLKNGRKVLVRRPVLQTNEAREEENELEPPEEPLTGVSKTTSEKVGSFRSRIRPTAQVTVTTEKTEKKRLPLDRRRFRGESRSTTVKPEPQTETPSSTSRANILLRRKPRPSTTTTTTTTEEPFIEQQEDSRLEESKSLDETPGIQDLTDPAVVAIHNLATVSPGPLGSPVTATINSYSQTPATYTVHVTPSDIASFSTTGNLASVTPGSVSSRPTSILTLKPYTVPLITRQYVTQQTPAPFRSTLRETGVPIVTKETYSPRSEILIQTRKQETAQRIKPASFTAAEVPREAAPKPRKLKPFSKVPKQEVSQSASSPGTPVDYEYYDDDEDPLANIPASALKVKVHSDGYIECLDRGNFPHPFSCKKFISCAKMENNELLGWEYTCPKHLSFDPVGGICNWSAGLGCQH